MMEQGQETDYFRDFGDGSFRVVEFWILEREGINSLHTATTILEWRDISQVQAWAEPATIPENVTPEGHKCLVYWCGREMKILASFVKVAKAWQMYREEKQKKKRLKFLRIGSN